MIPHTVKANPWVFSRELQKSNIISTNKLFYPSFNEFKIVILK